MENTGEKSIPLALWERVKTIYISTLQTQESKESAERYFSMVTRVEHHNNNFVVFVSNSFAKDFIQREYLTSLQTCIHLATGNNELKISFEQDLVPQKSEPKNVNEQVVKQKAVRRQDFSSTMPFNEDYTFENFVCGPSNSWAQAAAKGVVNNPGHDDDLNPLFIHGDTGLGKTHLMQAIGNELRKKRPNLSVCYITAETFLNEYINHLMNKTLHEFRDKYRKVDVLLVDDVQFLQKGEQCQEEFFNTFNALKDKHKQIVMTSDVAPKKIPKLEERLISRFEGGMVQEIESPSYETRLAILKKKTENINSPISQNILEFIATNIKSHVRAIEGALSKVKMFIMMNPMIPVTNDILEQILKDHISKEQTLKKLTIREIQIAVAKKYSVSLDDILSNARPQSVVTPRQLAMFISRKLSTKSLKEIGVEFNKSHATLVHGVDNIKKRLDVESELKTELEEILSDLGCKLSDVMD